MIHFLRLYRMTLYKWFLENFQVKMLVHSGLNIWYVVGLTMTIVGISSGSITT